MTNKERKEIRVLVRTVQETQKENKNKEEIRVTQEARNQEEARKKQKRKNEQKRREEKIRKEMEDKLRLSEPVVERPVVEKTPMTEEEIAQFFAKIEEDIKWRDTYTAEDMYDELHDYLYDIPTGVYFLEETSI